MSMTGILNRGMQRYIADSNSALLGLQPEDWLEMATPVNIPGTSTSTRTGAGSCPSPWSRCLPMNGSISCLRIWINGARRRARKPPPDNFLPRAPLRGEEHVR